MSHSPTPAIELKHLSVTYRGNTSNTLENISLTLDSGHIHGIIGPNGSGKSSLLHALLGLVPTTGQCLTQGRDVRTLNARERAAMLGFVPQGLASDISLTGRQFVELGRYAKLRKFQPLTSRDTTAISQALHLTGADAWANKPMHHTSGGQRQLTSMARAIAQDPHILLLDEPTSALDIKHEFALMQLLRPWLTTPQEHSETPRTIVVVLHDLELASRFCDTLTLVHAGHIVAHGTPQNVLTPSTLEACFGIAVDITPHPRGEWLCISPR